MIQNLIQIGEPVEHRGIVVAPLFPTRDPIADYVTLDDALGRRLRIREVDEAGSVPELVVENPLAERVLLYDGEELVGAKQNRILNVSVLGREEDAPHPRLLRRAGALAPRHRRLRCRAAHLEQEAPAPEGRGAHCSPARPRRGAGRGLGRGARHGPRATFALSSRRA